MDIDKVVISVQEGYDDQFELIVEAYQKQLFYYIYCIVGNIHDAEDLLQDTFFTSFKKINQYKKDKSFLAWLYKIARNKSINHLNRSKSRQFTHLIDYDKRVQESTLLTHQVDSDEKVDCVLKKLNIKEREIILLHLVEGRDYKELETILNKNQSTLRKRFERASKKFKEIYNNLSKEEYYGCDGSGGKKLFQV